MSNEKNGDREKQNGVGTGSTKIDNRMLGETDAFILRNVFYFLYAPNCMDRKNCLFFNPNHVKSAEYIKKQEDFLDVHFAGYLSKEKPNNKKDKIRICGVAIAAYSYDSYLNITRGELLSGREQCRQKGTHVRAAFLEKIQADYDHDQGFSKVISDMEKQNCEVLKSWDLDMEICITKLKIFIERMRNGKENESNLLEMPDILKQEILDLVEQQVQKRTWESMATAITWILIASLLRKYTGKLRPYYQRMGEHGEHLQELQISPESQSSQSFQPSLPSQSLPVPVPIYSLYSNPDEIKPYTMEDIGNLRNTYVQRTAALEQIYEKMHSSRVYGKRYVYISGIGGCGKTELARAYAYTHREEYDEIFWFTCDEEKMPGVEKLLADSIYGDTVTADILNRMDERCLLILDNCNSISSGAIRELHQKTGKAHLLVTTRLAGITQIHPEQILYLNESRQDNRDFVFQIFCANYFAETDIWGDWGETEKTAGKKEFSKEEKDDIESICRFVWYHPMAVAIIAVMLRENREEESIESFAGKCRLGLNQAFPMGERIPFGQGEQDYDEEPLEILKELFARFPRRPFTTKERQVLKILQLFPARQLDMKTLYGLLGDSSMDKSVKNDCRTLSSLQWIQSNGVWVTMHPLISQVLEIDPDRIYLEDETGFYRTVLEKWIYSAELELNSGKGMFFIYQLWKKSGVSEEKNAFNLAVSLLMDKRNAKALFEELYPEVTFAFTAIVREQGDMYFVFYDLMRREEVVFYQIKGEEVRQSVPEKGKSNGSSILKEEWVKLVFLSCRETAVRLDFPDCILGHEIEAIPASFCSKNQNISGLRLPQRLREIGWEAFKQCVYMSGELVFPETLERIGDSAFAYCSRLRGNLLIPGGVKIIGNEAFCSCGMDGTLTICEGVEEIGLGAFGFSKFCGQVFIPGTVKLIGSEAFHNCRNLTKVILSEGLEVIDAAAFRKCTKLNEVSVIPETVLYIGDWAFGGCFEWSGNLNLPENLKYIGKRAFDSCIKLSGEIIIPCNIETINKGVFYRCHNLRISKTTFHKKIQSIHGRAFSGCDFADNCIILPEGLIEIGEGAFSDCFNIREIIFGNQLRKIGQCAFANCTGLKRINVFPDMLEYIGDYAFKNCVSLKWSLEFPKRIKEIGEGAFDNCIGLKGTLSFPEGLIRIGHYAFRNCSSLTEIKRIPKSLEIVYPDSFEGCNHLTELEMVEALFQNGIQCVTEDGELIVPDDMEELTKTWLEGKKEFLPERIIIPEQIVKIGEDAFRNFDNLKEVRFSSHLHTIEKGAFSNCTSLQNLVLPESLRVIGISAFENCMSLKEKLVFPPKIKKIAACAFINCRKLEKIILPENLEYIEERAYCGCSGLKEVKMFEGLLEIGPEAFYSCENLKRIEFPNGLEVIGDMAFLCCRRLEKIQLPEGLKQIGSMAFAMNELLFGNLVLPESLEEIKNGAFMHCDGLFGNLVIPENVKAVKGSAFYGCHFSQFIIKNPDMEMGSMFYDHDEDSPIIWGYEDSTAFAYALKYGCTFRDIREWPGFDSQDTSMTLL